MRIVTAAALLGLCCLIIGAQGKAGDSTAIRYIVNQHIEDNNVMVFAKSYCPYCQKVRKLFDDMKISHFVVNLDETEDGSEIQSELYRLTSQRTVPNVFIGGKHVGGFDRTSQLSQSGELEKMVRFSMKKDEL